MLTTTLTAMRHPVSRAVEGLTAAGVRASRTTSSAQEVCDMIGIPFPQGADASEYQFSHKQFKQGQRVTVSGQPFDMLYVVYSGFLKTVLVDESGIEQVIAFPMKGDLLGVDAIHGNVYTSEVVALSNCELICIPFIKLAELGRRVEGLEVSIYGAMSRELVREHSLVSQLGLLSAEARVARFIVNMSQRFADMGYSNKQFNLRMTRQEIGSYLGVSLETVSRTLSTFNSLGLISVEQRSVTVHDLATLKSMRRLPASSSRSKQLAARKAEAAEAAKAAE